MTFTRRETLALGLGAAALAAMPGASFASTEEAIAAFTGGAEVGEGGIELTTPEIAENGNTVPVEVSAPGATSIMLLATGNPNPDVGTFNFGPLAGSRSASTRIRLAQSQDVIAIARMEDGSFARTSAPVKVTIGGCGG
ncbi:MAG: thiosulfate oxidation carrier protein SoxY [Rhodobacteraceae bacterium]|nr:thiosulfate oxidation carrier protein SoxY [Paracoccaceae bacterium]|tara:strand:- start:598 stop:1014 length:417 start_codon:yes stop_codon:yes gene_type:complete